MIDYQMSEITKENDLLEAENKNLRDRVILAESAMFELWHFSKRMGTNLYVIDVLNPYRTKYPTALIGEIKENKSDPIQTDSEKWGAYNNVNDKLENPSADKAFKDMNIL